MPPKQQRPSDTRVMGRGAVRRGEKGDLQRCRARAGSAEFSRAMAQLETGLILPVAEPGSSKTVETVHSGTTKEVRQRQLQLLRSASVLTK